MLGGIRFAELRDKRKLVKRVKRVFMILDSGVT